VREEVFAEIPSEVAGVVDGIQAAKLSHGSSGLVDSVSFSAAATQSWGAGVKLDCRIIVGGGGYGLETGCRRCGWLLVWADEVCGPSVGSHGDKLVVVETREEGIVGTEWNGAEAEQRVGEGLVDTEGELRVEGWFSAKETKKMSSQDTNHQ
jgi:hypothetical protein